MVGDVVPLCSAGAVPSNRCLFFIEVCVLVPALSGACLIRSWWRARSYAWGVWSGLEGPFQDLCTHWAAGHSAWSSYGSRRCSRVSSKSIEQVMKDESRGTIWGFPFFSPALRITCLTSYSLFTGARQWGRQLWRRTAQPQPGAYGLTHQLRGLSHPRLAGQPSIEQPSDETKYLLPSWGADKRSHGISCEAWRRLPVLKLNSLCQQTKLSLNCEAVCELLLGT